MKYLPLILSLLASACTPLTLPQPQPRATLAGAPVKAAASAWPDRRPIGRLDLCNEDERRPEKGGDPIKNPRAWNGYWHRDAAGKPLDATEKDYVAKFSEAFRTRCIPPAIARVKAMDAQILSIIDIEGREHDQPTSYEGNAGTARPPEMTDDNIRWLARICKDNGLGLGFTIRHTIPVPVSGRVVQQVPAGNYADTLMANIQTTRWLLSVPTDLSRVYCFAYYDSSNLPNAFATGKGPLPVTATDIRAVQSGIPSMLIQTEWGSLSPRPEWGNLAYLSSQRVAPWREAAYPANPDAQAYKARYGTFEIIMPTPNWTPSQADEDRLVAEVKAGDVMMFTASWDHPFNAVVRRVYDRANGRVARPAMKMAPLPGKHPPEVLSRHYPVVRRAA